MPDLNPIENIFNLVRKKLSKDTINKIITSETKESFTQA